MLLKKTYIFWATHAIADALLSVSKEKFNQNNHYLLFYIKLFTLNNIFTGVHYE